MQHPLVNSSESVDRKAMILEYYPLVKSVAYRLVGRFPANVEVDDLINVGTLGLIDAIERYTPERQDSFRAYAELRIRGAIIDELRQLDWVPRSVRRRGQQLEKAQRQLEANLGRTPTQAEVADHLGMSLDDYQQKVNRTAPVSVVSLEDLGVQEENRRDILQVLKGDAADPETLFEAQEVTGKLALAIEQLPERDRTVISLYYYEDLTLKEVGNILGVTESRVSQIHSRAIARLRVKLKYLARDWSGEGSRRKRTRDRPSGQVTGRRARRRPGTPRARLSRPSQPS